MHMQATTVSLAKCCHVCRRQEGCVEMMMVMLVMLTTYTVFFAWRANLDIDKPLYRGVVSMSVIHFVISSDLKTPPPYPLDFHPPPPMATPFSCICVPLWLCFPFSLHFIPLLSLTLFFHKSLSVSVSVIVCLCVCLSLSLFHLWREVSFESMLELHDEFVCVCVRVCVRACVCVHIHVINTVFPFGKSGLHPDRARSNTAVWFHLYHSFLIDSFLIER